MNVTVDDREADVAVLSITEARVTEMRTYTAPGESFGDADRTLTRTDRVAAEDVLVVRVDAPSFRGPLAAAEGSSTTERFESLVGSSEARFDLQQADSGGQTAAVDLDLGGSVAAGAVNVESHADGTLTLELAEADLVFDSGDNVGERFEVDLVLDEDSGLTDDNRASDAEFRFTERSATFDTGGRDRLALPQSANATVRGSTTVAPGTEFEVEVRAGGALLRENTTTATANRSFAARVDLSEASPGTEFTARVDDLDASAPGRVVQREPTTATTTERVTENTSDGGATGSETATTPGTTDGVTVTAAGGGRHERDRATARDHGSDARTGADDDG